MRMMMKTATHSQSWGVLVWTKIAARFLKDQDLDLYVILMYVGVLGFYSGEYVGPTSTLVRTT